jgi:hypothetical protein
MRSILQKPSLKSFGLLLLIWYLVLIVMSLGRVIDWPLSKMLLFFTKFTWPNFVLTFVLATIVVPQYLRKKSVTQLVAGTLGCLLFYVGLRYYNHIRIDPTHYDTYYLVMSGKKSKLGVVLSVEMLRGMEFVLLTFGGSFMIEWWHTTIRQSKMETEKVKAELSSLRYQINPHFLLNAMNNIYYLSSSKNPSTPDAILQLSALLKYVLYEKNDSIILIREIEHLEHMIHFHQVRFPEARVQWHREMLAGTENKTIPMYVLITFLENAFKHGAIDTETPPIDIYLKTSDQALWYRVTNPIRTKHSNPSDYDQIGINNLRKRLELLFGENFELKFEEANEFYQASLKIPLT